MPDQAPGASCPPHHWEVTSRRRDGVPVQHHRCLRCGAEKDVPFAVADAPRRQITLRGSPTDRRRARRAPGGSGGWSPGGPTGGACGRRASRRGRGDRA